ncbi:MAG: hypothetical protein QM765_46015 [Myxococcales bacterium]
MQASRATPPWELTLQSKRGPCAVLYLEPGGKGALVTIAFGGRGEHWLDKMKMSFHPNAATVEYLLVNPDGKWERRVISERKKGKAPDEREKRLLEDPLLRKTLLKGEEP